MEMPADLRGELKSLPKIDFDIRQSTKKEFFAILVLKNA